MSDWITLDMNTLSVCTFISDCVAGAQAVKKSGIPAPRELPSAITRDRVSLRDQLRSSSTKRMVSSASTSSLTTLAKQTRSSTKSRGDAEGQERGLLECQVKELLAEAKAKDLEISNLRTELQRCNRKASMSSSSLPPTPVSHQEPVADREQGQVAEALVLVGELREKNGKFQRELASLREENQELKEKLLCLEASTLSISNLGNPPKPLVNGLPLDSNSSAPQQDSLPFSASPLKTSVSSSSDITKGSPSPDSSEFEKIPSCSESVSSSVSGEARAVSVEKGQDVSVQSLTEKIHKMEENHHSTAEELQATLQELADQQQVMRSASCRLHFNNRESAVEVLAQKNEALVVRLQEQTQAQAQREEELGSQGPRLAEFEQRYAELVESSRFEREKLVDIQQQLTGSLRALEEEHQEAQGQVLCLREEMDMLKAQLAQELEVGVQATQAEEEQKAIADCLRLENSRLKAQVDIERQKVSELKAMQSAGDSTELQNLLKTAHTERDRLEVELTELKQELLQAQADTEHVRATISKMEAKCQQIQEQADKKEQGLHSQLTSLEEAGIQAENQVKELKETIFELEDQVEQQRAVNCHTNQAVLDMESFSAIRFLIYKCSGGTAQALEAVLKNSECVITDLVKKLEEQKAEAERQLKVMSRHMKDEKEEWRRFQADLQTAVVVANDIKVEAQQELRTLRRQLQEEQDRNAKLSADLEALQGVRSQGDEVRVSDADNNHHWCGISGIPTTATNTSSDAASEPGATVKSLIKSFDTVGQNNLPCCREDMKPNSLMRKSPSLESVIKTPASLGSHTSSFSYNRRNSKLSCLHIPVKHRSLEQYLTCVKLSVQDEMRAQTGSITPQMSDCGKQRSISEDLKPSHSSLWEGLKGASHRKLVFTWDPRFTYILIAAYESDIVIFQQQVVAQSLGAKEIETSTSKTNIDVTNFSSSWSDGLAFCALLHTYLPAHIPYQELISQDKVRNLTLAFQAAESIGIKPSLDIEELMKTDRPDWQSVMQYVSQIYKYFET
ncbi:Cytospin-B Nuclear structure protein 5 [Channa argus]|uniref:Cytospin-A n=1 Tax=Channa argus TaxID=215402 RepID=A0A6G1QWR6_CHAAH|nr:Cytospin-B Nuclear structure protein 5 [Channa argus]